MKNAKTPKTTAQAHAKRIELDPEVIADLEVDDALDVKGGASGGVGSRIRSGGLPTSGSASMT